MKYSIFVFAAILQFSLPVFSESMVPVSARPCTPKCIESLALPVMTKAVLSSNLPSNQDPNCPPSGSELFKAVGTGIGKAIMSVGIVKDLTARAAQKRESLQADRNHCGSCKQVNLVSNYSASAPNQIRQDLVCETPFAINFQKELNNQDIEAFGSDTLRGKNSPGQQVERECSKTCNYYMASAQTPISQTTSRINLTVVCGPPRQGSILTANYDLTVGFVHQWVCIK